MKIEIRNCNNIELGEVIIQENTLNIKYAVNGTGKSTIAKSIIASVSDRQNKSNTLAELTPFKLIGKEDIPNVKGIDKIETIKVFDEKYINDFVFQPDDLLKGSFDIFIRDQRYEDGMKDINGIMDVIRKKLSDDVETSNLIRDFDEISASFGKTVKAGIHGSSTIAKSFKDGNKVSNIPEGLELFSRYIQHESNYKWIKWQMDGKIFSDMSSECPFCVTEIETKKKTIEKVSAVYEPKAIESLNKIVAAFDRLRKYFSEAAKSKIDEFVKNVNGYSEEQTAYLLEIKEQIERLKTKFVAAKSIGFSSLKDVAILIDALKSHIIDVDLYVHLNSEETKKRAEIINKAFEELILAAGNLQGRINIQNKIIEQLVKDNSDGINSFLKNAGYSYTVSLIEDATGQHRLRLNHKDIAEEVTNVRSHLSYGERNAFALTLFMYDALKNVPDLIILDDPISSFDKNKKYALMDMLFKKGNSFRGKTTLLLTHDFEPIVDMTLHHPDRFSKPHSSFLENKHGHLIEKEIARDDIDTFLGINKKNISSNLPTLNKVVYLRRLHEITDQKGLPYQLVSSLLHKRDIPIYQGPEGERNLTPEEINYASNEIKKLITDFDYGVLLNLIKDIKGMCELYRQTHSNFEKLHIYRILFDGKMKNPSDIVKKFINEAFHIENNYIYQLNPRDFQLVPQHVIDECDEYVNTL